MRETVVLKAAWMSATEQVDTTSCLCARSCSLTYCQGREHGVKPRRGCLPHTLTPPGQPWLLARVSPLLPAPALSSAVTSLQ